MIAEVDSRRQRAVLALAALACSTAAVGGIDSQARARVEALAPTIRDVFPCGVWTDGARRGHHRVVLAEVSGGAGTEVYLQRVAETIAAGDRTLLVVSTTPIRELNDDHAQYQVSAAKCVGGNAVQLEATFEHDEGNLQRRIRIVPTPTGYTLSNVVVRAHERDRRPRSAAHPER